MAAFSSSATLIGIREDDEMKLTPCSSTAPATAAAAPKKKRNQPGYPNPDAEVIALSPKSLMATNRFVCEVCKKGFQREQNLQLHRRGHNLPWKLKQKSTKEGGKRKVYVCPEPTCVHHEPSRALGDLTGIKKHFSRKHGEKKWKCEKCSKKYAVQSDWKAHSKTCGTREYRCDCGTLFSRRDSFITHRAFCDALGEESILREAAAVKVAYGSSSTEKHEYGGNQFEQLLPPPFSFTQESNNNMNMLMNNNIPLFPESNESIYQYYHHHHQDHSQLEQGNQLPFNNPLFGGTSSLMPNIHQNHTASSLFNIPQPQMSATALLQKAAQMGATATTSNSSTSASIFGGGNHHHNDLIIMNSSFGAVGGGSYNNAMIKPSYDDDDDDAHPNIKLQSMSSGRLTRDFLGVNVTTITAASQPAHTITAPPAQPSPQSFRPNFH